jgi:hypothetical protein
MKLFRPSGCHSFALEIFIQCNIFFETSIRPGIFKKYCFYWICCNAVDRLRGLVIRVPG